MDVNTMFPSKYVGHADLQGQDVPVVMGSVVMERVDSDRDGGETKPVLHFHGMAKGLILNKTNAKRIADLFGLETDAWSGKSIILYCAETEYGGKPCKGVRVREGTPAQQQIAQAPAPPPPAPKPVAAVPGAVRF